MISDKTSISTVFSSRNIAAFFLVLMCIQYWPLEGYGVSLIKVAAMCVSPLILLLKVPQFSSAVAFGLLYVGWCFLNIYSRFNVFRLGPMGYMAMFWVCYMMFYNLIYDAAFSEKFFLKLMKGILGAYILVLISQQICSLAGLYPLPFLNLDFHRPIMKCQSLTQEPSSSARIMASAFYAFLKVSEYKRGTPLSLRELWQKEHWLILGFLYAMISMTSGTAIFALGILLLYFLKPKYGMIIIVIPLLFLAIISFFQVKQLDRITSIVEAIFSGDSNAILLADGSAAFRVLPMWNIFYLDFFDLHTWLGYGVDTVKDIYFSTYDPRQMVGGGILDYGFFSYLISLAFVFTCCIKPFFSLPTLMFLLGIGGGTGNIAYGWGILMIFTCVSYFDKENGRNRTIKNTEQVPCENH